MLIKNDLLAIVLIFSVLFIIFFIGKIIYKRFDVELSRKFVHIFSSLFALSFPFIISNHLTLLFLSIFFSIFIFIFKFYKNKDSLLKSVVDIDRKTIGEILFPMSIYLVFIFSKEYYFYLISLLVLALSDALAAIIGKKYGKIKIPIEQDFKTLEGSLTFFIITFLAVKIPLILFSNFHLLNIILISFIIAILITMLELISIYGTDNIFIPLGVLFLLQRLSNLDVNYLIYLILSLFIITFITFILFYNTKIITISGIIVMIIVNYTCFALTNIYYFFTLFYFEIIFFLIAFVSKLNYKYDVNSVIFTTFFSIIISFFIHFNYSLINEIFFIFLSVISWQAIFIFNYLFNYSKKLDILKRTLNLLGFFTIVIFPVFIVSNILNYLPLFLIITLFLIMLDSFIEFRKINLEKHRFFIRNILIFLGIILYHLFINLKL
ncbi:MAG: hypothetical protein N2485_00320 [bacterium]|nr:hypothetical protein [bacterium]